MADNKEIEFETPAELENTKPAEVTKLEGLESKVAKMEASITQILSAVDKMSAKLSEAKPEPVKEDNALKDSVTNVDKKVETLAKKVEELEAKPARITQTLGEQVDADKRAKEIASSINGAEMLVYAEKNHIKWGKGE